MPMMKRREKKRVNRLYLRDAKNMTHASADVAVVRDQIIVKGTTKCCWMRLPLGVSAFAMIRRLHFLTTSLGAIGVSALPAMEAIQRPGTPRM